MCTICQITETFDPSRHPGGPDNDPGSFLDTSSLTTSEMSGAVAVSVDSSTFGVISIGGEQDIFSVTFEAGNTYVIDGLAYYSGGGSLGETDLHLYDSAGNYIDYDDASGDGLDAQITFTATTTSTYFIMVDGYGSYMTGSYTLDIEETVALPPPGTEGTIEQLAKFLKGGTNNGVEYTFDTSSSNQITVDISGLTAEGKQLAIWAMEAWEMVVDLDFVVQNDGIQGNEMITVDDEDSGAFAYYPNTGSTSIFNGYNTNGVELNVSKQWLINSGTTLDSYSFQTYVHEFGHAIGLNHLGDYNFDPFGPPITYANDAYFTNDSWQMSVMSYFSQTDNTTTNASYGYLAGPMIADIMAIQDFYGAPGSSSATAGNTTYGLGSNLGNYLDEIFAGIASGTTSANYTGNVMAFTIYDQGGIDTLNISFLEASQAARVNLNGGTFSDFGNLIGIMGIAVDTVLENVIAGAGNDTVIGNAAANLIRGRQGNDSINGANGNDSIEGGIGNDTLRGGDQFDTLRGGDGNDLIFGGFGRDLAFGGNGNDRFIGSDQGGVNGQDTVFGGTGADTLLARGGNDAVHGNQGNDSIEGGNGNDQLFGGDQFDTIRGGDGNDTAWGGNGRDLIFLGEGNDVFNDNGQGGDLGRDTVFGYGGNDTLRGGGGNDALHGNQGNDSIEGGGGNDMLYGGLNYDTILGGNGNDTVWGGDGRDLVFLGEGNDVFNDNGQAGVNGQDTVWGGGGNDTLNGGGGNDTLNGNQGNDRIFGGNGNDRVFGGLDNDTMTGGAGVDTFVYNDGADIITDFGTGADRLQIDDALWAGTLTATQVVNTFASVQGGDVVFNFGGGNTLTLDGVNSTAGLDSILTFL